MRAKSATTWLSLGLVIASALLPFSSAHAKAIKWVLDGIKWDNYELHAPPSMPYPLGYSSTATGWFLYDASGGTIGQWNIEIRDGPHDFFSGGTRTVFSSGPDLGCDLYQETGSPYYNICSIASRFEPRSGTDEFEFGSFTSPGSTQSLTLISATLTEQGGTVLLSLDSAFSGYYGIEGGNLTSGRLIAVPEAAIAPSLLLGLILLTLLRIGSSATWKKTLHAKFACAAYPQELSSPR